MIDFEEFERLIAQSLVQDKPVNGFMDCEWNRIDFYVVALRYAPSSMTAPPLRD
jgi:hypothetical protein